MDGIPEELGKESFGMKDCLKGSGFLDFLGFLAAGLSPAGLDGESPTGLGRFGGFFLESAPATLTSDGGVTIGDNICIHATVKLFYYSAVNTFFAVIVTDFLHQNYVSPHAFNNISKSLPRCCHVILDPIIQHFLLAAS